MRYLMALILGCAMPLIALAGHTRQPYVDGCQSVDGRYVVTAEYDKARKEWRFTWKDTRQDKALTGLLVGLKDGQGHFSVTYGHIFVAPDGETFALWNGGAFAPAPGFPREKDARSPAFRDYPGFADRLVVYKKTGEVVKRLGLKDLLRDDEWNFVHSVQGNLYWSVEYPDADKGNIEAPRAGYRAYRISPDYTILECVIGPCEDLRARGQRDYRRVVRIRLTDGMVLPEGEKLPDAKMPVRPFIGDLVPRMTEGNGKIYTPSLDPVRSAGKIH